MRKAMVIRAGRGIGGALVEKLIGKGVDVIAYSGSEHKLSRLREALAHSPHLITVQGDVRNSGELLAAADGVDVIFCGIYLTYDEKPNTVRQMLEAVEAVSSRTNAKVVIIEGIYRPADENERLERSELRYLRLISPELYGAEASNTIIHYPLKKIAQGEKAKVLGNPENKREYLYLDDAAQYAVELASKESAYGKTWRLRGGPVISTEELLLIAGSAINTASRIERISGWQWRLLRAYEPKAKAMLDGYERANRELQEHGLEYSGSSPATSYEAGIAETVTSMVVKYRNQSAQV